MSNNTGFIPDPPKDSGGFIPDPPAAQGGFIPDPPKQRTTVSPVNPTPIHTPHTYDSVIQQASARFGVDANLLRAVGMQESGLGKGLTPQGLSPTPGNAGHGIWQLDPASGASASDLAKAASDPEFAASYAGRMLSRNLAATHGDLRGALAMYNAGSPTSKVGLQYADQVIGRIKTLDPISITHPEHALDPGIQTRVAWHVKHFVNATGNRKDPMKAVSHTPELQAATHVENQVKSQWSWFKKNPLEGVGDILSAPMRAEQAIVSTVTDPKAFHAFLSNDRERAQRLRDFNNLIWHPSAQVQAKAQEGFRQGINRVVGRTLLPSDRDVDHAIRRHIWKPIDGAYQAIVPATSATAQVVNDFAQQTLADPFTPIDAAGKGLAKIGIEIAPHVYGLAQKGIQAGTGVARAAYALMHPQAQRAFSHLGGLIQQAEHAGDRLFTVRRDLDQVGFTREGKQARMAIENKHDAAATALNNEAKKVAGDHNAAASLYAQHMHKVPGHPTINRDINILNNPATSAAAREEILNNLSRNIRDTSIKNDTHRLLANDPKYFRGNVADINSINMDEVSQMHKFVNNRPDILRGMANTGKQAIMWNSLPHGLVNEGTLTFMAGGLPAIMHGINAMVRPVAQADVDFLKEHGALPEHMMQAYSGTNPLLKTNSAVNHQSQKMLEHIELGWRIGLMKTLENKLGPATTEQEKLIRGWLINDKAGDYRNQNAFTQFFQALGGPFTAFHLGIVPKAFLQTIRDNPDRIKNFQRLGQDIQNHADTSGGVISDSSPMSEGADMLVGLGSVLKGEVPEYAMNSLNFKDFIDQGHDEEGGLQRLNQMASHYLAPVSLAEGLNSMAHGTERPVGPKTTLSERLMDLILGTLGKHIKKKPEVSRTEMKKINKGDL